MDRFTGFKTATTEELPDETAVMDPSKFIHYHRRGKGGVKKHRPWEGGW